MQTENGLTWHRLKARMVTRKPSVMMKSSLLEVFQAIVKEVSNKAEPEMYKDSSNLPFFHIHDRRPPFNFRADETLDAEILFCKEKRGIVDSWQQAFSENMSSSYGSRTLKLVNISPCEERNLKKIIEEIGPIEPEGEICLDFMTPFHFNPNKNKKQTHLEKDFFVKAMTRRLDQLFKCKSEYCSERDSFELLPYYWKYTEIRHPSHSQPKGKKYINGCFGPLYLKGRYADILPFILLCSELHAGTSNSYSQGYYRIHPDSFPFFDRVFPSYPGIISSIHEIVERQDRIPDQLSGKGYFPFNEKEIAIELHKDIESGHYQPLPHTAFVEKIKEGDERLLEHPAIRDLIVQHCLNKLLGPNLKLALENSAMIYNAKVSRQHTIEAIRRAITDGYGFVIESDIEDFFPSIDLDHLRQLLDFYLPKRDERLRSVLLAHLENGFMLDSELYLRQQGLAQGSPLSLLLSGLYLEVFDDARLIRSVDKFLVLTRTRDDAEKILERSKKHLQVLGVKLSAKKTSILTVHEAFRFLGFEFPEINALASASETTTLR